MKHLGLSILKSWALTRELDVLWHQLCVGWLGKESFLHIIVHKWTLDVGTLFFFFFGISSSDINHSKTKCRNCSSPIIQLYVCHVPPCLLVSVGFRSIHPSYDCHQRIRWPFQWISHPTSCFVISLCLQWPFLHLRFAKMCSFPLVLDNFMSAWQKL